MDQFVSTFTNKIDAKGRVSVPVSFRTVLAKDGFEGIYCYPSLDDEALESNGVRRLSERFGMVGGRVAVVLIGKDGGVKLRREGEIDLDEIFERIDGMPMRRNEMRRSQSPRR